jgi:hypothetical protein
MLDAYVIEEIWRREREKPREDRPSLDLPLPPTPPQGTDRVPANDEGEGRRGVVIIDYG